MTVAAYQKLECVNQLYSKPVQINKQQQQQNKWLVETVHRNSMNVNYLKALIQFVSFNFKYYY